MSSIHLRPMTATTKQPQEPEMLLIFRLSGEIFAITVTCVHEILDPLPRTEVPNAPDFAPALINVRGSVAPLIDVRQRLRMPPAPPSIESRVIVLELPINGTATKLAMTSDSVDEVIEADLTALEAIPELGTRWPEIYIRGGIRHGDLLVVLLNTETLFRPEAERPSTRNMRN